MFLLVLPFWVIGIRKIRQTMNAQSVPLIALLAAFSFIIMMFNVPMPGGTTAHAIGASLAAIILGPEVATIVVSIALIIQAFFFGDGGILAIGANCFNMAVIIPYIASAIYHAFSKGTSLGSRRRLVGAAVGGWVGVTVACIFCRRRVRHPAASFQGRRRISIVCALSLVGVHPCHGNPACVDRFSHRGFINHAGHRLSPAIKYICIGSG